MCYPLNVALNSTAANVHKVRVRPGGTKFKQIFRLNKCNIVFRNTVSSRHTMHHIKPISLRQSRTCFLCSLDDGIFISCKLAVGQDCSDVHKVIPAHRGESLNMSVHNSWLNDYSAIRCSLPINY